MIDREPDGATRSQISWALARVAVWFGSAAGLALIATSLLTSQFELLPVAAASALIGALGLVQHITARPLPLVTLLLASVNGLLLAPTSDRVAHAAILPSLTLFAFVGAMALPKRVARWYAGWCGVVGVASFPWILPGLTVSEFAVGGIMFVTIALAGWRFVSLAADVLAREEESHRLLFHGSPVAVLEEDFTQVARDLSRLRSAGIVDLEAHLRHDLDELRRLVSSIEVRRANPAALAMIGVGSVEELMTRFRAATLDAAQLEPYLRQICAVWDGQSDLAVDLPGITLGGRSLEAVLHWSATRDRGKVDFGRVVVNISDVTPRKEMEDRLAHALEANRSLLDFEHALALCSRSLLLGSGDEALEKALTALRAAMGADRAYLTVNVEDPREGPSFHVVRSVSVPRYADDEWMGQVVPWSRYPTAVETLREGRPFQHIRSDLPGTGWRRSVLTVPVFTEGRWAGSVGFMDMERRSPWSDEAVRMLEVAAPMLGTYWEREVTRQRLEDLVRSKDHFVASVSHELRTPLAAVLGFAEELKAKASSFNADELTAILELIADQSQEVADMVEDLLVAARADIGKVSVRPQHVYLRSQAEAVLAGLGQNGEKQIEVVGGRGRAWADPSRTRQIIRNLLTNSIRYGGREVVVEASELGSLTVLEVTDDGPGLDPSHWERIFEPYQRAHDQPTQPASIGLGLTVSRQLARLMGGDLVYRRDHRGSVFTLTLPAESATEAVSGSDGAALVGTTAD